MQARRQFDTGVDTGRNDAALKRAEPSRPGRLPSRTARSLGAVLLVAFAAILGLPLQAEAQTGICGRTEAVRTRILGLISGVSNCANVTDAHLAAITGTLFVNSRNITALAAGDFDGLTALTGLTLNNNSLTTLPAGVFDELTALTQLTLNNNSLSTLPDDVFEPLTALTTLFLNNNPGAPFSPTADALPDDGGVSSAGGTVTLDGSGSGPWGTNVTYSWAASGAAVTFDDATSATTVATIPALTEGTELTFTLTVTGRPINALGVAPDTDTATVSVFDPTAGICGRTAAVRTAILGLTSGVSNCALVTDTHLADITALYLNSNGITALAAGDFDGLTALEQLRLYNNSLSTLPAGVFDELTALTVLNLRNNSLSTLPAGVFDELTALTTLRLQNNSLSTLPAGVFDELTALTDMRLQGNPGAPFSPTADALPDDGTVPASGGTVTLDGSGSDGGPWGTNVTYSWALTAPTSGVTVTFDDAASATPVVTIPALTAGAELTFTLTVTGRATNTSRGTAPDTDTATVTVAAFDPTAGICGRTEAVRDNIVRRLLPNIIDCADVTDTHLAAITGTLDLRNENITALAAGDFDGLTALTLLNLISNSLSTLPAGVFDELTALTELYLGYNDLTTLPAGVFDELTALTTLWLGYNDLSTLPDDVFDELTALTTLVLQNNPGAPFSPTADALPDDGEVSSAGGTVTLNGSGSDGGPWGTNVTYSWALTSPASGATVTFDAAASAKPVVTIPALTAGAELTFTLTVTGRGGTNGTAPDTDTATVTVTAPVVNAAPSFTSSSAFSAAENQTAVGTAQASDSDTGDSVTGYAIHGGADASKFSIAASTGVLTFASAPNFEAPADTDTDGDYVVQVRATSGTGARVKTADQTITVTVTDVAGEAPGVPVAPTVSSASVTSVTATWTAPTNAGPAITDYDYRHRVKSPVGNWTEVTTTTSTALRATITQLAEDTEYEVQVRATNAEGTSGWSGSGSGSTDANASPSFTSSSAFSAAENQTAVGTAQASDSDTGDSVTGYAIQGGADVSKFSIAPATGVLTFASAPNFEAPADADTDGDYVVVVRAMSGTGERVKTADQTITVTVTDAGGEAPGVPVAPSVSSASVTSVTATWTAPANAGPAIGDYDYRYRAGSPQGSWTEVTTTTSTALGATIAQLAEDTEYDVQVRATNGEGTSGWSDSGSGSTDANASPSFTSPETFGAPENQIAVGTVEASDSDTGDSVTGYTIQGGADVSKFSIAPSTGVLTFASAPNFEAPADADTDGDYVVVVRAMSGTGARVKTADQTITVTVTNAGGEAPGVPVAPRVSSASVTSVNVSWTAPANAGPAITDYDYRHRVKSPQGLWTEVTTTTITALGTTIAALAEDTGYDVQVRATNGEGTSDWSASGSGSTDANASPSFTSPETFGAPENQTAVGTVAASDSDTGDSVTGYAIQGGADASKFSLVIVDSTGVLTFASAPNFEAPADADTDGDYVVVVRATSGTGARVKTADQTITVTVTNAGGEAPGVPVAPRVSSASVTSLNVSWTAPANAGPEIGDYDYRHRVGSPQGLWTEVTTTTITALGTTIAQLAEDTGYDVQVRATNGEGTSDWSASGSGSTDANASPSFTSPEAFNAPENQIAVGTVAASDSDTGDSVTGYAIQGGADVSKFSIAPATGVLTFASAPNFEAPADADTDGDYVVVVRATSGTGARVKTAEQTITVTVTNAGGEAPGVPVAPRVSSASVTSLNVSWTAPANAGPAIGDYDYRYRAGSPQGSWTEVTTTTITALGATIAALAEDTGYDVQVRATNGEGTSGWSASGSGSTDANASPSFTSPETFGAPENQIAVGTVQASDSDTGDSVTGYTIQGGADVSKFSIVASTGALTFASAPNFEAPADADTDGDYVVVVRATSGTGVRVKTAEVTITVTVTNAGGEAPGVPVAPRVSSASATSLNVSWTAPANAGPAITDYDYRHRAGSPQGLWTEVTTTTITALGATIAALAEDTEYDVQVRATNGEGTSGWSASGSGSTDANASPSFTSPEAFNAPENQTAVGTVAASDSDTDDSVTGYVIQGGADASKFSIAPLSGALTFASAPNFEAPADADTDGDYVVVVRATSGTGARVKTAEQTITVTVTNAGGEAPGVPAAPSVSSASVTSLNVSWTAPANAGPEITDYDYRHRAGSPQGSWTEVTTTTITALGTTITQLAENAGYDVQVRATNGEGTSGWSGSGSGSTDANASPSFTSPEAFGAPENQTAVGTVAASDSDTGDSVTGYTIQGGADASKFLIVASSGALTFASAPNFEAPADADTDGDYVVVVRATSGTGARVKTAEQTITVTVTDVGGEAPGVPAAPVVSPASVTNLNVSWTAPTNAGPPITDYDYRHRVTLSQGSWTEVTTTTITGLGTTIEGLAEDTEYDVQVRATNDEGTSGWSDSGMGMRGTESGAIANAPENLQATAGDAQATLTWSAPNNEVGADITGYAYRYKESGGDFTAYTDIPESGPGEANARSYTVTELNERRGVRLPGARTERAWRGTARRSGSDAAYCNKHGKRGATCRGDALAQLSESFQSGDHHTLCAAAGGGSTSCGVRPAGA